MSRAKPQHKGHEGTATLHTARGYHELQHFQVGGFRALVAHHNHLCARERHTRARHVPLCTVIVGLLALEESCLHRRHYHRDTGHQ